ncbi:MAG: DOMON-like domain-containing protein [Waterburya sp.]
MKSTFDLVPFASNTAPAVNITGDIERQNNQLKIEYKLTGNLSQIIIAEHADAQTRQYDLWEHTCFEFFLGIKDSTKYWEFNLSPAGHWNIFRFPDYRQDISEEMAFDSLPFTVLQQNNSWQLNLEVDLEQIIPAEQNLEVGITSVIEDQQNHLSYWALTHSEPAADFHHRDSFIVDLSR